jgi:hypothetical protein
MIDDDDVSAVLYPTTAIPNSLLYLDGRCMQGMLA